TTKRGDNDRLGIGDLARLSWRLGCEGLANLRLPLELVREHGRGCWLHPRSLWGLWKEEKAEENRYFREKTKEQLFAIKKHREDEIEHHKEEIKRLQKQIERPEKS
ncbi:ATPase inhibitor, mitochondrial, partial [Sigmodon hispidus]